MKRDEVLPEAPVKLIYSVLVMSIFAYIAAPFVYAKATDPNPGKSLQYLMDHPTAAAKERQWCNRLSPTVTAIDTACEIRSESS